MEKKIKAESVNDNCATINKTNVVILGGNIFISKEGNQPS